MRYPNRLIGWLFDVLHSLDWQVSILDILETERKYPGLMDDLSTESWQRKLVRDQMSASAPPSDDFSDSIDGLLE